MSEVINLDVVAEPDMAQLVQCRDEMMRWKLLYEQQRDVSNTTRQQWDEDIKLIGERLIKEANDRGFCSEFDDVIDDLNSKLRVELPTRRKEYVVTQVVKITRSITVYAKDEEEALDDLSSIDNVRDLDRGGWTVDDIDIYEESAEEQ